MGNSAFERQAEQARGGAAARYLKAATRAALRARNQTPERRAPILATVVYDRAADANAARLQGTIATSEARLGQRLGLPGAAENTQSGGTCADLSRLTERAPFKKRFIDLAAFNHVGPLIDWPAAVASARWRLTEPAATTHPRRGYPTSEPCWCFATLRIDRADLLCRARTSW
jgi:hypothetical protein